MEKKSVSKIKILIIVLSVILTFNIGFSLGAFVYNGGSNNNNNNHNNNNNNKSNADLTTFNAVYNILNSQFLFKGEGDEYEKKLINDAISGMVDAQGDIHTTYMSAEELSQFTSSLESNFVGIGVQYVELDKKLLIVDVIKSSPAEAAGMLPGDIIVAVDSKRCEEYGKDYIVNAIKGEIGSKVIVTVLRDNKEIDIAIIRNTISSTVDAKMLKNNIGYLEITQFANGTFEEVGKQLEYLKSKKADKLIIDLRNDSGGYVDVLVYISSYFIAPGETVIQEQYLKNTQVEKALARVNGKEIPRYSFDDIVVLVNDNTASAAEAFTMLLKDYFDAKTVGETTYGKGIGQSTELFADGSALKYTNMKWLSPKGTYIGTVGIIPDYPVMLHPAMYTTYLDLLDDEQYGYDSVGSVIQQIQEMLDFLGYEVDRTDGYYSQKTVEAVKTFQKDNHIEVTGIVDKNTGFLLNSKVVLMWHQDKMNCDTQLLKAIDLLK